MCLKLVVPLRARWIVCLAVVECVFSIGGRSQMDKEYRRLFVAMDGRFRDYHFFGLPRTSYGVGSALKSRVGHYDDTRLFCETSACLMLDSQLAGHQSRESEFINITSGPMLTSKKDSDIAAFLDLALPNLSSSTGIPVELWYQSHVQLSSAAIYIRLLNKPLTASYISCLTFGDQLSAIQTQMRDVFRSRTLSMVIADVVVSNLEFDVQATNERAQREFHSLVATAGKSSLESIQKDATHFHVSFRDPLIVAVNSRNTKDWHIEWPMLDRRECQVEFGQLFSQTANER